jgi:hypothetical protein
MSIVTAWAEGMAAVNNKLTSHGTKLTHFMGILSQNRTNKSWYPVDTCDADNDLSHGISDCFRVTREIAVATGRSSLPRPTLVVRTAWSYQVALP